MFKKRLLCLALVLLLVLPLLLACKDKTNDPNPPASVEHVLSLEGEGGSYVVIAPGGNGDDALKEQDAATSLYSTIYKDTGIKLKIGNDGMSDYSDPDASRTEILVGVTNRNESTEAFESLREKDYLVAYRDGRILILGGSPDATAEAVTYFLKNHYDRDEKSITVSENSDSLIRYDYLLGNLSVNGTPLKSYVIVYPRGANLNDPVTYYTAVALADYLSLNAGISLNVVPDSNREREHEILVGKTSRAASNTSTASLSKSQFYLHTVDSKIVMLGKSYMVAGAASQLINEHFKPARGNVDCDATDLPTSPTAKTFAFQKATSAILLIGDGMGMNHIDYTISSGLLDHFVAKDLPSTGTCTTISQSVINGKTTYTDSAAAATALATGYKTLNGYLGLDASGISQQNVRELAHEKGAKTAVITTDNLTGATPSGFLCHHKNRNDSAKLQAQIDTLKNNGKVDYVYGKNTDLIDPAREGLSIVSADDSSFFVMIEEAHIDKKAHYANSQGVWDSVIRYNEIISYIIPFVMLHPDTALIITADHETGGLIKNDDGSYSFENLTDPDKNYYQHTATKAPVFALGYGTDTLLSDGEIDNTDIAKFIAEIYGDTRFGN